MLITAPDSETPAGVVMKVSQELAISMIAVPTMFSPSPSSRCVTAENFPQP